MDTWTKKGQGGRFDGDIPEQAVPFSRTFSLWFFLESQRGSQWNWGNRRVESRGGGKDQTKGKRKKSARMGSASRDCGSPRPDLIFLFVLPSPSIPSVLIDTWFGLFSRWSSYSPPFPAITLLNFYPSHVNKISRGHGRLWVSISPL